MKMGLGRVVTQDDFWDREHELSEFVRIIDSGGHIHLSGQRRMGKTSLMKQVEGVLKARYFCIFVDLEQCSCAEDAIKELSMRTRSFHSLWEKTRGLFGNVLNKAVEAVDSIEVSELAIKLRSGITRANWIEKGDQLFHVLARAEKPVLLLLDEVPIMVNRMLKDAQDGKKQTDYFMSWLRKNSMEHQGKVQIVIAGSIGLEPILKRIGLGASINTFVPLELRAWDEKTAMELIVALGRGNGIEFEDGAVQAMLKALGCRIPHHVQMFFTYVHERCRRMGSGKCTVKDVVAVYKNEMLGSRGHVNLTNYEERLEVVLGKEMSALAVEMVAEERSLGG